MAKRATWGAAVLAALALVWWWGCASRPAGGAVILCYHRFETQPTSPYAVRPEDFRRQMAWLRDNGYRVAPLSEVVSALRRGRAPAPKTVVLTFDDGYRSFYYYGFPILRQFGYPATVFLYLGFMSSRGDSLWWPQILEMSSAGFDFGSHTFDHFSLLKGPDESAADYRRRLRREIRRSREFLGRKLAMEINWFSYPYGVYDREVKDEVAAAGYQAAVALNGGAVGRGTDRYALSRLLVPAGISDEDFAKFLRYRPLKARAVFPPDGGRIPRARLGDFRVELSGWPQTQKLTLLINKQKVATSYVLEQGRGVLRLREVPSLPQAGNVAQLIGEDLSGREYIYTFLFWLRE